MCIRDSLRRALQGERVGPRGREDRIPDGGLDAKGREASLSRNDEARGIAPAGFERSRRESLLPAAFRRDLVHAILLARRPTLPVPRAAVAAVLLACAVGRGLQR